MNEHDKLRIPSITKCGPLKLIVLYHFLSYTRYDSSPYPAHPFCYFVQ